MIGRQAMLVGTLPMALVALGGMALTLGISYGPQAALFAEMFSTGVHTARAVENFRISGRAGDRERPDTILRPELGTSAGGELLGPPAS